MGALVGQGGPRQRRKEGAYCSRSGTPPLLRSDQGARVKQPLHLSVLIALLSLVVMALASSGTSATSNVLYAAYGGSASASDLYTVDPATGAKASVGAIGFAVTGLAVQPGSGTLFGVTSGGGDASTRKLITINKTTGAGTVVGSLDN